MINIQFIVCGEDVYVIEVNPRSSRTVPYISKVTGVNAGALDVLHDTRNQDIGAVADCINLDLLALQIFINQDRMLLCDPVDDADKFIDVLIADGDLHTLSSKDVGRADEYRIAELIGCFFRLFCGEYGVSLRTRDFTLLQDLIEQLTVL